MLSGEQVEACVASLHTEKHFCAQISCIIELNISVVAGNCRSIKNLKRYISIVRHIIAIKICYSCTHRTKINGSGDQCIRSINLKVKSYHKACG